MVDAVKVYAAAHTSAPVGVDGFEVPLPQPASSVARADAAATASLGRLMSDALLTQVLRSLGEYRRGEC
jgi:hypothetical protein